MPRPDLKGMTMREVWLAFCENAKITHNGELQCDGINSSTEVL